MSITLKLVGPATYSLPGLLSRPVKRGEVIRDVPEHIAERLLAKGFGEGDDFKPYFKEVHERRAKPARRVEDDDRGDESQDSEGQDNVGESNEANGKPKRGGRQRRQAAE